VDIPAALPARILKMKENSVHDKMLTFEKCAVILLIVSPLRKRCSMIGKGNASFKNSLHCRTRVSCDKHVNRGLSGYYQWHLRFVQVFNGIDCILVPDGNECGQKG
jgi:hypothetical protein